MAKLLPTLVGVILTFVFVFHEILASPHTSGGNPFQTLINKQDHHFSPH